jgi:transcriptional regulator with GAF, ATPase, and Fis domain
MNPRLIVIGGSLKGAIFEVGGDETAVGRDASNEVRLIDPSVSRRHSLIKREGEAFKIIDQESFNGTFVNGVPVSESPLSHGDQVTVGNILMLFLLHESSDDAHDSRVLFDDTNIVTQSAMYLRREEAFYLNPEKVLSALPPTARLARDLGALLKISTIINSIHQLDALQRRLLELILEVVPARRAALLLADESGVEHASAVCLGRTSGADGAFPLSRTVTERVLREGVTILCNDTAADEPLSAAASLAAAQVRALLCTPLTVFDDTLGVIYLESGDPSAFNEYHLQLLTAIGGIAAVAIENAQRSEHMESEGRRLSEEINLTHRMVGGGERMRELYKFIAKVAPSYSTVLIRGESGTGKELAARAIHANSARAEGPFVAINCATLSESLIESELFGHERGAFTGAVAEKKGKLEVAAGGTLFLDEVGELAPALQAKLLRVLQEREFERVGGTRTIKADIRVIAATNKDLEAATRDGSFRQDLYYRLNVISFTMPPLRERREDIPLLAAYFAAECCKRAKKKAMRVSTEARSYLISYDWPGNVRELENAIERAVILGSTDLILPEDLPDTVIDAVTSAGAPAAKFYDVLRDTKKRMILNALEHAKGNYTEAARLLGVHPNNLHRLVRNMGLRDAERE